MFWSIFNLGAVLGSCIPIGDNWYVQLFCCWPPKPDFQCRNSTENKPVKDGTYVGFLVLMVLGAVLATLLVPPQNIVRKDGTRVQHVRHPSIVFVLLSCYCAVLTALRTELKGLYETMFSDPYIILLFPFFWASNFFYTYQLNCYQLFMFNTRTRSFTGLWYWLAQIVGAIAFGWFLDLNRLNRRNRAIAGWGVLFLIVNAVVSVPVHTSRSGVGNRFQWGGGLKPELGMSRPPNAAVAAKWYRGMDIYDKDFIWYCLLMAFYGFLDAAWQTYAYWLMGALSNDPRKLAYFAGFYKVTTKQTYAINRSVEGRTDKNRESNPPQRLLVGASTLAECPTECCLERRGASASSA